MPAAVTGEASGHTNIRATHRKTLEVGREHEIGPRATCVVGVAARLDEDGIATLHGRVALTLSVAGHTETVRGRLNPAFEPGDPLVVRLAPAVTRDAMIIDADRAAASLSRSFVAELAKPSARIAIRVEALAEPVGPGVLVVQPVPAEHVGDIDRDMRGKCRPGQRVTLRGDLSDPEIREVIRAAHDAGHTVLPAPGLSLLEAVRAVAGVAADTEVTEGVRAEQLERRLAQSGGTRGAIVLDPGTPREQYLPWWRGQKLDIPGARGRTAAFAVEAGNEEAIARAEAMAAAGGSTRDVARALQDDAGLPHRRAYELALDLTADTSSVSRPDPRTSR